jgi:glutamate dehydrogenase (NAD(P)+)
MYTVREACKKMGLDISKTTAAFQGFGNVSQYAVELYTKMGGKAICVSCWDHEDKKSYTYRKMSGLTFDELIKVTNKFGEIDKVKAQEMGFEILPGEAWIEQDVDILVPSAIENQVTGETVKKIGPNVKIVAEGANGPTTPEADEVLKARGILNIPDFLANAGGVTCSYFEQVQCNMNYFWTKEEVLDKLDQKMTAAFNAVYDLAQSRGVYMRDAAYLISISRVAEACKLRGWV